MVCPCCQQPISANAQEEFFDKLVDALRHPVPSKAAFAAQVLGKLADPRGVEPLLHVFERTRDPETQEAAVRALGQLKDPRAVSRLAQILHDPNTFITLRIAAANALGEIGDQAAVTALQGAAKRDDSAGRQARTVLGFLGVSMRR